MTTTPHRVLATAISFAVASGVRAQEPARTSSRFRFVIEASQLGPVGYRDPVGVVSPDGHPTDKTQPAVSRDGTRIAFTVFSYRMQFWVIEP